MEERLTTVYCQVDDFVKQISPEIQKLFPKASLHLSEVLTISIIYHSSGYRTFKHFYLYYVSLHLKPLFPKLCSYCNFVKLKNSSSIFLKIFLENNTGSNTGIYYIDSTPLPVCKMERKYRHRVFNMLAKTKKSTFGFFHGLKLHLLINQNSQLIGHVVAPGNKDDRSLCEPLTENIEGKLFADKGYLSENLFWKSIKRGLKIITRKRKNMTHRDVLTKEEEFYLARRRLIETVFQQLKESYNLWHSRFRSVLGGLSNVMAALAAYTLSENKPTLKSFA